MKSRGGIVTGIALLAATVTLAQTNVNSELQEKVAAVKQAAAENKQKLQQYTWIETIQLTLKGDPKPPTQNSCRYGPDGQVQKTPLGPPPQQPSGGKMKQNHREEKRRNEGLHARCEGCPRHVCSA